MTDATFIVGTLVALAALLVVGALDAEYRAWRQRRTVRRRIGIDR